MSKVATVQREVEKDVFEVVLGTIKMRVKRDECSAPFPLGGETKLERRLPTRFRPRRQKNCTLLSRAPTRTKCAWVHAHFVRVGARDSNVHILLPAGGGKRVGSLPLPALCLSSKSEKVRSTRRV